MATHTLSKPGSTPSAPDEIPTARLSRIRHVVLDMDGTIYEGGRLFDETLPFLDLLQSLGLNYTFVTNNSSVSKSHYLERLRQLGVSVTDAQVLSSTDATVTYLHAHLPQMKRLYVVGTDLTRAEFEEAGFNIVKREGSDSEPDVIVVGFDTNLGYKSLCRAAYWIQQGKPYLATHPDVFCPTDQPTVLIDCGAICAALAAATGRHPDAILGKPDPRMLDKVLTQYRLTPDQIAVVGDRLHTDVAMANRAGAVGIWVLTGDQRTGSFSDSIPRPDLTLPDLGALGKILAKARRTLLPEGATPEALEQLDR